MASLTLKGETSAAWMGRVVPHGDVATALAEQREKLGEPEMPRNPGDRRTESKQVLLKALAMLEAKW